LSCFVEWLLWSFGRRFVEEDRFWRNGGFRLLEIRRDGFWLGS
jgi:hypothetical protein